jgi:glycosyltransferase involved in cell wall biosynthesis
LSAVKDYNVFNFNFGSSLLPDRRYTGVLELKDLKFLKSLGKKIIVTYQGCDARQKRYCINHYKISACAQETCYDGICNESSDKIKKERINVFDLYADKIFALNPDLLNVLPARTEFLPYANVDLNKWYPDGGNSNRDFIIVHSPTNRMCKGTEYVINAVDRLKEKYRNLKLILVEKIPHDEVMSLYKKADLAIDQLLVGWYGGFAVEMMALGKPVVCYIREEDLKYIPMEMKKDLPVINAQSDNLYAVLDHLIASKTQIEDIGKKSRDYVEKWHDPMKIALRMKNVYESLFNSDQC